MPQRLRGQRLRLEVAERANPVGHRFKRPDDACKDEEEEKNGKTLEPRNHNKSPLQTLTAENQVWVEGAEDHHDGCVLLLAEGRDDEA